VRCGFASPCGSFVETRAFHKSACHNSSFYGNRTFRKQPQRNVLYFVAGFGNLRCTIESLNTKQAPVQYVSLAKELQTALIVCRSSLFSLSTKDVRRNFSKRRVQTHLNNFLLEIAFGRIA